MNPLHLALSVATALPLAASAIPASAAFSDVPSSHPYYNAVLYVQAEGIVAGYPNGTYQPDSTINRAEFAKILVSAKYAQSDIDDCKNHILSLFTDTPRDAWFTPYVCTAFRNGIVSGYPDMSFRPANPISFAEAAKMIKETFGVAWSPEGGPCTASYRKWLETSGSLDDSGNPYWWQKFVCALQTADAMPPSYGKPDQLVTRAEMAEMIYRIQGGTSRSSAVSSKRSSSSKSSAFNRKSSSSSRTSSSVQTSSRSSSPLKTSSSSSSSSSLSTSSSVSSSSVSSPWNTSGSLDLSVDLTGSKTLPVGSASRTVFYSATLANGGPADMAGPAMIRIINSGNMVFLADRSDAACAEEEGGDVICAIDRLRAGESYAVTVKYDAYPADCSDNTHVVAVLDDAPSNDTNALNNESPSLTTTPGC